MKKIAFKIYHTIFKNTAVVNLPNRNYTRPPPTTKPLSSSWGILTPPHPRPLQRHFIIGNSHYLIHEIHFNSIAYFLELHTHIRMLSFPLHKSILVPNMSTWGCWKFYFKTKIMSSKNSIFRWHNFFVFTRRFPTSRLSELWSIFQHHLRPTEHEKQQIWLSRWKYPMKKLRGITKLKKFWRME